MGAIATVETALLDTARATLGATVKVFDSIGGNWSMDALKRALQNAPGVYAAFLGARRVTGGLEGAVAPTFAVYVVTKAPVEAPRRHGSPRVIGAYEMVERLAPRLDGLQVPGHCTLRLTAIDNLFQEATFDIGGAVYGISLTAPSLDLVEPLDPLTLDDFITFDHRIEVPDGTPQPHDSVTLPQ